MRKGIEPYALGVHDMSDKPSPFDLLFLGSGNAFAPGGRAFSSFLLNERYLFDCGPTVLQQLQRAQADSNEIEAVFISHFHADHFFGLPFLLLDSRFSARTKPLTIIGPPDVQARTEALLELGYPSLLNNPGFERHYVEVTDGVRGRVGSLDYEAARVDHVPSLESFAFKVTMDGRSLVYSGDTTFCDGLLRLAAGSDVLVLECACKPVEVHLSPSAIEEVARRAPDAKVIVTHLDGHEHPHNFEGLIVADDLKRISA